MITANATRSSANRASEQMDGSVLPAEQFKAAFRRHPAGVAVVTAETPGGPVALTATSVISLSAEPPLFAFSASHLSSSTSLLLEAETLVLHFIDVDAVHVAKLGATSGIDRFADSSMWRRLESGEPVFNDVKVWIRGEIVNRVTTSGATVLFVRGIESSLAAPGMTDIAAGATPLAYNDRTWHALSGESALAP